MEVIGKDPPKTVLNHRCQIHGGRAAYESDENPKAEAECRFSCRVTAFGLQSRWRAGPTIRASEKAAAEDWLELYGDQYPPNPPIANDGRPVCKGDPGCAVTSWEHWVNKWHSTPPPPEAFPSKAVLSTMFQVFEGAFTDSVCHDCHVRITSNESAVTGGASDAATHALSGSLSAFIPESSLDSALE